MNLNQYTSVKSLLEITANYVGRNNSKIKNFSVVNLHFLPENLQTLLGNNLIIQNYPTYNWMAKNITHINFLGNKLLQNFKIGEIFRLCKNLHSADLSQTLVTFTGLGYRLNLPQLKKLILNKCLKIQDEGLRIIFKAAPNLSHLEVSQTLMTSYGVDCIPKNIKVLNISKCKNLFNYCLRHILISLNCLEILNLSGISLSFLHVFCVKYELKKLKRVNLSSCISLRAEHVNQLLAKCELVELLDIRKSYQDPIWIGRIDFSKVKNVYTDSIPKDTLESVRRRYDKLEINAPAQNIMV